MSWFSNLNTGEMTLELVLTALFIGVSAAILISLYNKRIPGEFIRRLKANNATTPETAMTLYRLGYRKGTRLLKFSLREGATLRSVVKTSRDYERKLREEALKTEGKDAAPESSSRGTDPKKAAAEAETVNSAHKKTQNTPTRYYLPEELSEKASSIYPDKKGSVLLSAAAIIIFGLTMIGVYYAVPELVQLTKNFINILSAGL